MLMKRIIRCGFTLTRAMKFIRMNGFGFTPNKYFGGTIFVFNIFSINK